jgi:DNA-binding NarL/FixJ family response regulator
LVAPCWVTVTTASDFYTDRQLRASPMYVDYLRPHLDAVSQSRRRSRQATRLTPRQSELLRLVALGYTNHQIARRLSVTEATVRKHLEHIFERLQVTSRTAAVTQAFGSEPDWLTADAMARRSDGLRPS